ncbi:hypothetical protein [Bacillus mojavensis]|jgi:N-acetylneuraminate synthase|uniref:hypothetical protein n=1 Tax=Bacillus mojavensis TaxID=72360 RepID=UPI00228148A1|nr:hypothetical protein [Bacillus mojavensis]MCY9187883.1 hypothetical protein [Bacillus mojavensis]
MAGFQIANKTVGKHAPVFNSFETGINYDGKWDQAFARINAVSEAGWVSLNSLNYKCFKSTKRRPEDYHLVSVLYQKAGERPVVSAAE